MITEIKGDITKVKCDYICQQNNCIAVKPHGLSLTIAREMGVCPYSRRRADGKKNLAIEEDRPPLGRILTEKSPFKDVHVICMFAQYSYGTPQSQYYYSRDETYKTREEATLSWPSQWWSIFFNCKVFLTICSSSRVWTYTHFSCYC